jgi:hypothetical protein
MDRLIAGKPRIRKLFESLERSLEDEEHLKSLADNTRLNARQAPSLYRLVEDVAASARMSTPRVFLDTQPEVNAWALGQRNPMIVLTSALVDEFTEAEVRAVVAHELGHIRCQHTFYRLVSQGFDSVAAVASALPGGSCPAHADQYDFISQLDNMGVSAHVVHRRNQDDRRLGRRESRRLQLSEHHPWRRPAPQVVAERLADIDHVENRLVAQSWVASWWSAWTSCSCWSHRWRASS